jgi:hypothetical protein
MTSLTQNKKLSKKQQANARRHAFLLTFFNPEDKYQQIEKNGYILIKQYNGNSKRWEVAIYSKEAFKATRKYLSQKSLYEK